MLKKTIAISLVLWTTACTATVQPIGEPPERLPEPAHPISPPATETLTKQSCIETIMVWLSMFRSEQEQHFAVKGRFADDETVGGRLHRLGKPFETQYLLGASSRRYYIRVRNGECRRQCEHERERIGAYEPDDEPLACVPY